MTMQVITSRDNETIKQVCKIASSSAQRKENNAFLAEGVRLCIQLAAKLTPIKAFYTEKALQLNGNLANINAEHYIIAPHVAQKMAATKNTQGAFVLFELPNINTQNVQKDKKYVILEDVQNPSNIGAVARSAAAFGFDGLILVGDCADAYADKALRAGMGAHAYLDIICMDTVQEASEALQAVGIKIYAAELENAVSLDEIEVGDEKGVAVLFGNEGAGLSKAALEIANCNVCIPMCNTVESLNVSVAAGVLLYHFRKK